MSLWSGNVNFKTMENPLQHIIKDAVDEALPKKGDKSSSKYQQAKQFYRYRTLLSRNIKDFLLIVVGIFSAGFGLEGFLLPNNFIDGGATGISLLISEVTNWPLALLLIIINIPFVILGYKQIG